jgi:hypothetical protein
VSKTEEITGRFCLRLMQSPATVEILSDFESVSHLERSVADWLGMVFDHQVRPADPAAFFRHQASTGCMFSHANIAYPTVSYAALMLKRIVEDEIEEFHSADEALILSCYASEMIDYALACIYETDRHEVSETIRHQPISDLFVPTTNSPLHLNG